MCGCCFPAHEKTQTLVGQETLTKRPFKLSELDLFGAYEEESTGINLNIHIILCSGGWSFFC